MRAWIFTGLALSAGLAVTSCGGLRFAAANAPALFGDFERRADVPFGSHERQRLDVYVPAGEGARPIIVFWYGGAWEKGSKERYRFVGAALAEAGFVAVLPDYRLYPQARFPDFIDDGALALSWVLRHAGEIGGDATRVYVAGHSAGAHLAAMLAYDADRLRRVGMDPRQVRGLIGLSGPYALNPDSDTLNAIFASPHGQADWQPVRKVSMGEPPALLIHGESDDVVNVSHARAMADALSAAAVPVTLRKFARRGHADTVAAFAAFAPDKLPVMAEIRKFVGETSPPRN